MVFRHEVINARFFTCGYHRANIEFLDLFLVLILNLILKVHESLLPSEERPLQRQKGSKYKILEHQTKKKQKNNDPDLNFYTDIESGHRLLMKAFFHPQTNFLKIKKVKMYNLQIGKRQCSEI